MNTRRMCRNIISFLDVKRSRFLNTSPRNIPFLLLWITNKCNLRCKMCGQWKFSSDIISKELSTKEWCSIIDSASKLNTFVISITGGEPFLRPDIFQILEKIHEQRISSHVCTNGTLLDNTIIKKLAYSPPCAISISLDSYEAKIHNELRGKPCFHTTIKGIKRLREKIPKIKIGINFVICKKNFHNMDKMVDLAKHLDIDQVNIQPIRTNLQQKRHKFLNNIDEILLNNEDMPKFKIEIKKFMDEISRTNLQTVSNTFVGGIPRFFQSRKNTGYCYAGYISCAIDPLGYVSPCADIDGVESVRDKKLKDIWRSYSFQQLRTKVRKCRTNCWDTTQAELNIRCSVCGFVKEFNKVLKDMKYYLD